MTATPAFATQPCPAINRRARAHGVDRLIMRASMATLLWARRRADRAELSRDARAALHAQARAFERREHESALRAARIR